jgi:hypothetical protein
MRGLGAQFERYLKSGSGRAFAKRHFARQVFRLRTPRLVSELARMLARPGFAGREMRPDDIGIQLNSETGPIVDFDEAILNVGTWQKQHLVHAITLAGDRFERNGWFERSHRKTVKEGQVGDSARR